MSTKLLQDMPLKFNLKYQAILNMQTVLEYTTTVYLSRDGQDKSLANLPSVTNVHQKFIPAQISHKKQSKHVKLVFISEKNN